MTVTVVMSKQKSGRWSAQVKGNGPELGKNLLTGALATSRYEDAQGNVVARLKADLHGITPKIIYVDAPQAPAKEAPSK